MSEALAMEETEAGSGAIRVGGLEAVCDLSGALWLPGLRTLVVADLHLEKGSSFARRGQFLPPYDSAATLAALAAAIARLSPRRVICLGDSFHDTGGAERLPLPCREGLAALQSGREWLWVTGNHDPSLPRDLGGEVLEGLEIAGVSFVHEPGLSGGPQIAGHLHPVAKVRLRGRALRRRCFVSWHDRAVLPAFGAYAGGLNIRDAAFGGLFRQGRRVRVIGDGRLFSIDERLLFPD